MTGFQLKTGHWKSVSSACEFKIFDTTVLTDCVEYGKIYKEVIKMFKKIRKYLIVLMAVVMVASLAVIPTSAAMTGSSLSWVESDYWYVNWWRYVYAYGDSTQPYWLEARVWGLNGEYLYGRDTTIYWGPLDAEVNGPNYPKGIDAEACQYACAYGPL